MAIGMEAVSVHIPNVVVGTTVGASDEIQIEGFQSGYLRFVSGSLATITYHASTKATKGNADGTPTFGAAYGESGVTAVTQAVASNRAYPIPAALFGAAAIKMVGDAAGVVDVCLKT